MSVRLLVPAPGALLPMLGDPAALAGPPLDASSFPVITLQSECLARTLRVLRQAGIRQGDIQETSFRNDDAVYAFFHQSGDLFMK